jgi:UDP-2,4-diacetamido-2,4,6-trideoxy-beta-L-altropyranose hydrolase
MAECPDSLVNKLKDEGIKIHKISSKPGSRNDADETARLAIKNNADWIVVDGYAFKEEYQNIIKKSGKRLLFVDDYGHCKRYNYDIVINQNSYANDKLYSKRGTFTKLLLGTKYVLLRQEFRPFIGWRRKNPKHASKLLVTLGGSDPDNTTLKTIKAIKTLKLDLDVRVVVGGANPHIKKLEEEISKSSNLQILRNVTNMPELMAWADLVITSGGGTCWEACFMGLPNVIIYCAKNQRPVARSLDSLGAAVNLGHNRIVKTEDISTALMSLALNYNRRKIISETARSLVDGLGAEKIVGAMNGIFLRKVEKSDCKFIWQLSNSKSVREASFSKSQIPWNEHRKWFDSNLKDGAIFFCVAETLGKIPVGQIRFRIKGRDTVVSTSLLSEYRGRGYGHTIIRDASHAVFSTSKTDRIHAYIRQENEGSLGAFKKAGFTDASPDKFARDNKSLHLILEKSR